jgi:cytochrome c-type biogenesis protein CcmH
MAEFPIRRWLAALLLVLALPVFAKDAQPVAANPELEARMMAPAQRQQIREMLGRGMSEAQIRSYMTDRYGDFVLYNPPLKTSTALLWAGPGVLLVAALAALFLVLRRRQRMAADAFDPDTPEDGEDLPATR